MAAVKLQHPHFVSYLFTAVRSGEHILWPYWHQKDWQLHSIYGNSIIFADGPFVHTQKVNLNRWFNCFDLHPKPLNWCQEILSLTNYGETNQRHRFLQSIPARWWLLQLQQHDGVLQHMDRPIRFGGRYSTRPWQDAVLNGSCLLQGLLVQAQRPPDASL